MQKPLETGEKKKKKTLIYYYYFFFSKDVLSYEVVQQWAAALFGCRSAQVEDKELRELGAVCGQYGAVEGLQDGRPEVLQLTLYGRERAGGGQAVGGTILSHWSLVCNLFVCMKV